MLPDSLHTISRHKAIGGLTVLAVASGEIAQPVMEIPKLPQDPTTRHLSAASRNRGWQAKCSLSQTTAKKHTAVPDAWPGVRL